MFNCTVIGDVTIDTFLLISQSHVQCTVDGSACQICFDFGAKIPIQDSYQAVGGNAANVSSALSKLGNRIAIVTELGDDVNGEHAYEHLVSLGIDASLARKQTGKSTRYSIIANYESDRTVFSYHAPRSYSLPTLPPTEWIYYTSLGRSFERLQTQVIDLLRSNTTLRLAVNPGSYQMHDGIRLFKKILPHTEILFVNKEEAEALTDVTGTISEVTKALHERGITTVIITDGDKGSYASNGDAILFMPIYPTQSISKTGAGDAYASGCLAAYMRGHNLATCMQWGTANASSVIQQIGAHEGQLSEKEITAVIRKYWSVVPKEYVEV